MALTNGSLYGKFDGQATGNVNNTAWNACNATNPNQQPNRDLFQILGPGGAVLLRVNSAGTVSTNVAAGVATSDAVVAQVQLVAPTGLGASPTAAQIMAATFPQNFQNQKLDIFQVVTDIATINVNGGGGVIFRFKYDGTTATS